jgi:hypothetical protein
MYPYLSMDEEIFLAPESIISGVLTSEADDDPTADLEFQPASIDGPTDID